MTPRLYRVIFEDAGPFTGHEFEYQECELALQAFDFALVSVRAHNYSGPLTMRITLGHPHDVNVTQDVTSFINLRSVCEPVMNPYDGPDDNPRGLFGAFGIIRLRTNHVLS